MVLFENAAKQEVLNSSEKQANAGWNSSSTKGKVNIDRRIKNAHVKMSQLAMFAEQLASMLQAGLPLSHALDTIVSEVDDKIFRAILIQIKESIFAGNAFSDCLKQYPRAFPPLFYNMVEAGEVSGSLPDAISTIANYLDASVKLSKKFKSALTYPTVVISLSLLLVAGLMIWVVPVFGEMFSGFGANLPWLTQKLIDTSNFIQAHVFSLLFSIVVLFFMGKSFFTSPKGAQFLDITLRYVPLFGTLVKKTNIARFCRTYSVLLANGVPILKAVDICTNVANSFYLSLACSKIKKGLESGQQLSQLMQTIPYFPKIVCNMTKAGEQSGNVEKMIRNVALLYENDVNNMVSALTSLLEPFVICFLGIVIGVIVIAMFMPIFQLSSLVH